MLCVCVCAGCCRGVLLSDLSDVPGHLRPSDHRVCRQSRVPSLHAGPLLAAEEWVTHRSCSQIKICRDFITLNTWMLSRASYFLRQSDGTSWGLSKFEVASSCTSGNSKLITYERLIVSYMEVFVEMGKMLISRGKKANLMWCHVTCFVSTCGNVNIHVTEDNDIWIFTC